MMGTKYVCRFVLGVIMAGLAVNGFGQRYIDMMQNPLVNFYDVKYEAERYFNTHDKDEESGYTLYKRWEWYMQQHIDSAGNRFAAVQMKSMKMAKSADAVAFASSWQCLGPLNGNAFYGAGRVNYIAIDPNDTNVVWSAAATGGIWKSTDGGANWAAKGDFNQNLGVSAIAVDPNNSDIVYAGTGDYDGGSNNSFGLIVSRNGGASWRSTGLVFEYSPAWPKISDISIDPDSSANLLVSTTFGLYLSADSGATFQKVLDKIVREIHRHPANGAIVYAVTENEIYRSANGGATFAKSMDGIGTGGSLLLMAVTPAAPEKVYVANLKNNGMQGFYVSTDSGLHYTFITKTIAVNDITQLGYNDCMAVSATDPNMIVFGTVHLNRSADGGLTWRQITEWDDPHCDHHFLVYNKYGVLYNANDGGIWKTKNNGGKWIKCNGGFTGEQYYKMGENRYYPDVVLAGAQDNGFHYLSNDVWQQGNGGDAMESIVDYNNPSRMVGLGYLGGSILTSTNGGKAWTINTSVPENGLWVTPMCIDPIVPNTYYIGYSDVYRSSNFCKTWRRISNKVTGGTGISIMDIYARNANVIYIAAGSKLFRTINGGRTWSKNLMATAGTSEAITGIAISQNSPDEVWVSKAGYSNGKKIYCTTDGGVGWKNLSYNLPNLPFNTIVLQNDTANGVYAGSDEAVYYTNKNLMQWVAFNTNLPRAIVNELNVYAPKGKLRACTYGRGIWQANLVPSQPANSIHPAGMNVYFADGYSNATTNIIDNDTVSSWTSLPDTIHELRMDLKNVYSIDGLMFRNIHNVSAYEVYISADSVNWGKIISKNNQSAQHLDIYPTEGRFVKLVCWPVAANEPVVAGYVGISAIAALHPIAAFDMKDTVVTTDGKVGFTDKSTNNPTFWLWEFGDGDTSTVQNPIHTYKRKGKYTVLLTASNNKGIGYATKLTYVDIKANGIDQPEKETYTIALSPNPALDFFNISLKGFPEFAPVQVYVYDSKGVEVCQRTFDALEHITIQTASFRSNGELFLVKVTSGHYTATKKLVLRKYKKAPEKDEQHEDSL